MDMGMDVVYITGAGILVARWVRSIVLAVRAVRGVAV
jgi:hypothetical protein